MSQNQVTTIWNWFLVYELLAKYHHSNTNTGPHRQLINYVCIFDPTNTPRQTRDEKVKVFFLFQKKLRSIYTKLCLCAKKLLVYHGRNFYSRNSNSLFSGSVLFTSHLCHCSVVRAHIELRLRSSVSNLSNESIPQNEMMNGKIQRSY